MRTAIKINYTLAGNSGTVVAYLMQILFFSETEQKKCISAAVAEVEKINRTTMD